MKISTRKSVIFAAFAAAILVTALVISCTAPIDGISGNGISGGDTEEPTRAGTGRVKLSINPRNTPRTILPTALPASLVYWVTFEHGSDPYSAPYSGSGSIVDIPAEDYTGITVIVCTSNNSESDAEAHAIGEGYTNYNAPYQVTDGGTLNLSGSPITTNLYAPGTDDSINGTFKYTFTIDPGVLAMLNTTNGAQVKATLKGGAGTVYGPYDITSGSATEKDLPSGYYDVLVTLTNKSNVKAYLFQILHVYQNMTSSFAYSGFTTSLFPDPVGGESGAITIDDPAVPSDLTIALSVTSGSPAVALANGGSTKGWTVGITNSSTVEFAFTITHESGFAPTGQSIFYIDSSAARQSISFTPQVTNTTTQTINFEINASSAPFLNAAGKGDILVYLELTYKTQPIAPLPLIVSVKD